MMQAAQSPTDWEQYYDRRDPVLRERLILQYAPLVKYVVGRMAVSLPGVLNHEDLLSYGTIGLIQAVDRFDPSHGVKFETYAIQRIRGAIIDAVRGLQPRSRDTYRRARELEDAYDALTQRLGRTPEDEEVTAQLGLTVAEFRNRLAEASTTIVSIDTPIGEEGEHLTLADQLADERLTAVDSEAERQELFRSLVAAIEDLSERDRLVITLYYYEELTLKEISEVMGVSTSRISQLHAAAVFKLRSALRAARLVPA